MKKVWIVEAGHDYDGFTIMGVFESEEKAQRLASRIPTNHTQVNEEFQYYYDFVQVEEFLLQ